MGIVEYRGIPAGTRLPDEETQRPRGEGESHGEGNLYCVRDNRE